MPIDVARGCNDRRHNQLIKDLNAKFFYKPYCMAMKPGIRFKRGTWKDI
jgi:hypothetical protein